MCMLHVLPHTLCIHITYIYVCMYIRKYICVYCVYDCKWMSLPCCTVSAYVNVCIMCIHVNVCVAILCVYVCMYACMS